MNETPIACTLSAGDLKARLASIDALNRAALRAHRREDLLLELTYAATAAAAVREMVRREEECCAFLDFNVVEDDDAVRVVITASEAARIAFESLFEQFGSGQVDATARGCC